MIGNVRVFCTITDLRMPVQVFDICIVEEVVRLIVLYQMQSMLIANFRSGFLLPKSYTELFMDILGILEIKILKVESCLLG